MKQIAKFFALAIVMIAFSVSTFAQGVSATANASATIITPLTITKTADMNFGNIAVGIIGGTVVLTPAGARSATGDVSFQSIPAGAAAAFNVTGSAGLTYSITLPTLPVPITSGGNTMNLTLFTSNPASPGTLVGGPNPLTVGATLTVGASQAVGAYTGSFSVTVAYN